MFGLQEGRVVAVGASDDLLTQYVTPLPDADFDVTVTLADHGRRQVDVPPEEETTDAADASGARGGAGDVAARGRKTAGEGRPLPQTALSRGSSYQIEADPGTLSSRKDPRARWRAPPAARSGGP